MIERNANPQSATAGGATGTERNLSSPRPLQLPKTTEEMSALVRDGSAAKPRNHTAL